MAEARILVVGDPHFQRDNVMRSDAYTQLLVQAAITAKPDRIVIIGDTLHTFNVTQADIHVAASNMLKELRKIAPIVVMMGNHDLPGPRVYMSKQHFFSQLELWSDTLLVDVTTDFTINGFKFRAVPYVVTGRFADAVGDITGVTAVFSHQQFRGSRYNNLTDETGDVWAENIPCINGHIHDFQINHHVICVGSSRQSSFRDVIHKTVSLFTFKSLTPEIETALAVPKSLFDDSNGRLERIGNVVFTHERLPIVLEYLLQITIGSEEFLRWEPPVNSIVNLMVTGTFAENAPLRISNRKWPNVTVKFDDVVNAYTAPICIVGVNGLVQASPGYYSIVEKKIQDNSEYVALYMALKQHGTTIRTQ
jgi:hypothetical protein